MNEMSCSNCTGGYFCPYPATVNSSLLCPAGYYCPPGTDVWSNTTACPVGHECPEGTVEPVPCKPGYFQNHRGSANCSVCPAGSYCVEATIHPITCPAGSYCPFSTEFFNQYLCPVGTYSNQEGLSSDKQCNNCTGGFYCASKGLTTPTGPCKAGYFCRGGSKIATPYESGVKSGYLTSSYTGGTCASIYANTTNDICPPGYYCPERSSFPNECPSGSNSTSVGLSKVTDCSSCLGGYFCNSTATTFAMFKCPPGYFCPGGTTEPNLLCESGSYCPYNSPVQFHCSAGYYQDQIGQSSCKVYCNILVIDLYYKMIIDNNY